MGFTNAALSAILIGIICILGVFGLVGISFVARIYPNKVNPADGKLIGLAVNVVLRMAAHTTLNVHGGNPAADIGVRNNYVDLHPPVM